MSASINIEHPSKHLNGVVLLLSALAGAATVILIIHQVSEIRRKAQIHEKEHKLLDLQIKKHEQDLKQTTPEQPVSKW